MNRGCQKAFDKKFGINSVWVQDCLSLFPFCKFLFINLISRCESPSLLLIDNCCSARPLELALSSQRFREALHRQTAAEPLPTMTDYQSQSSNVTPDVPRTPYKPPPLFYPNARRLRLSFVRDIPSELGGLFHYQIPRVAFDLLLNDLPSLI